MPQIVDSEYTIVGGDFNNAKIHGAETVVYTDQQINALYTEKNENRLLQFDYNYHRIKLCLSLNGLVLTTPTKGISCRRYKSKIDHFASRGVEIVNAEYVHTESSDHTQLLGDLIV